MLNTDQKVEECDATEDDSSNADGFIKKHFLKPFQ